MHRFELDKEFNLRIKHNFKLYVLLTSKGMHWSEEVILGSIYRLKGYKRHKTVKYGPYTSHIHVKFEEESFAKEAVELLNRMNCGLTSVLVEDMLRDWFVYELISCCGPPCTLTIVDIIGNTPFNLNFLTSNILNTILKEFGTPYLLPYTAAVNEPHVQVLFNSMTEALAACIAFGEWYYLKHKIDSFSYRVRINPSNKEANLIGSCGGIPSEAFKLDYFSRMKKEIKTNYTTKEKGSKSKASLPTETRTLCKRKCQPGLSSESQTLNLVSQRTPIFYFPIITTNCLNTPMSTSHQLSVEMTAILNFQQTGTTQGVVEANTRGIDTIKESKSSEEILHDKEIECLNTSSNYSGQIPRHYTHSYISKRRQTRIFERRA